MKPFLGRLARYFLQGLILVVPLALTISILYKVLHSVDSLVEHDTGIHGLGLLIVVTSITLAGFLGSTFIATPIINYFQRLLDKAPLLKVVYTSIKDLLSAVVGKEKKFNKPVKVRMNKESEIFKLGFITQDSLESIGINDGMIAVYLPHSYNFSGELFIVPKENVTYLENVNSGDVMKFIVSGGVTEIEK